MTLPFTPAVATDCNCSLCRRIGGPWVYFEFGTVTIEGHPEATAEYIQGDRTLRTIRCRTCGCVTHWEPLEPQPGSKHGVNLGNFDPALIAAVRVRKFDGADTWKFFDELPPQATPTHGVAMSTPTRVNEAIQTHYARSDLGNAILAALERAGKDPNRLTLEDLAPVDEFHIRGRAATLELARAAGLDAAKRVLDVGSGVGGTSRCLAKEFGCRVTGIDLTEEYCRAAALLSAKIGLADLVDYRQGDATRLPFDDASFDVVWTEHVAMNIPDKSRLYREMHRVLKPGGTLAIYDVLDGPSGPVHFPVPWARTPDTSFLVRPDELRRLLEAAGFTVTDWSDTTDAARSWFASLAEKIRKEGLPPLGFHILLGADFQAMAQNQRRNLEEGRIVLAQVIASK